MASQTLYIDVAAGTDTGSGTVGDPFKTIGQGMTTIAGTNNTLYVKASGVYPETVTLKTGAGVATPNRLIGYTSNVTDGGIITIDGSSTRSLGLIGPVNYWQVYNVKIIDTTGNGFSYSGDYHLFINCHADGCGSNGFITDNGAAFYDCTSKNNGTSGFDTDQYCSYHRCTANSNTSYGFFLQPGSSGPCTLNHCLAYDNGNYQVVTNGAMHMIHCTIDGNTTEPGLLFSGSVFYGFGVFESIFVNCTTGIRFQAAASSIYPNTVIENNVMYNNTNNFSNLYQQVRETNTITGNPQLAADYSLGVGSSAIGAGFDNTGATSAVDTGAIQLYTAAGTGGSSRIVLTS